MSKSFLIIDTPKFCSQCSFVEIYKTNDIWEFEEQRCGLTKLHSKKPENNNCPLIPLQVNKYISKKTRQMENLYLY